MRFAPGGEPAEVFPLPFLVNFGIFTNELNHKNTENELLKGQYELSCIAAARTVAMES